MLITNNVKIKISSRSKAWYLTKGYNVKVGDVVEVLTLDLSTRCNILIQYQCDYCKDIIEIPYSSYYLKKEGKECCSKCAHIKTQDIMLNKYGEKSAFGINEFKEKAKQTIILNHGTDCYFKSDKFKETIKDILKNTYDTDNFFKVKKFQEKQKNTNLEKYGVTNVFSNEDIKEKIKETNLKKYGVEYANQSEIVKNKIKETNIERYGVENPSKNLNVQNKIKLTNIDKYGVEYPYQNSLILEKCQNTLFENYGVKNPTLNKEILEKAVANNKKTVMERYGVTSVMLVKEIKEKAVLNSRISMSKNGNVPTSKNQIYLQQLFGGELNKMFYPYFLDIYFNDEDIYLEYDGSGHDLCVKMGQKTESQFKLMEIIRYKFLKNKKLKMIRIKDNNKKLISDDILLSLKKISFDFLKNPNNNWIIFDINNNYIEIKNKKINCNYNDVINYSILEN